MNNVVRRTVFAALLVALAISPAAFASHSWGGYHWARTSNPFTLKIHDNIDPAWEGFLGVAVADWNTSRILDFSVVPNSELSSDRKCSSAAGVIEICNLKYGQNGWLGIAGISVSGKHITKAYTKLNDTYFAMAKYNNNAFKQMVVCQEIAHDFGLDHQDEAFGNVNLGTCMDYTNAPQGGVYNGFNYGPDNTSPNSHDFEEIESIYAHLDATTTIAARLGVIGSMSTRPLTIDEILSDADDNLGVPVRYDEKGRPNVFVKPIALSKDGELEQEITKILWADLPGNSGNAPGRQGED
jgi:hypothetical protein